MGACVLETVCRRVLVAVSGSVGVVVMGGDLLDVSMSVAVGGLLLRVRRVVCERLIVTVAVGISERVAAWDAVAGRVRVIVTSAVFVGFTVGVAILGSNGANISAHTESAAIPLPHTGALLIDTS